MQWHKEVAAGFLPDFVIQAGGDDRFGTINGVPAKT
jgi:hypothetical protein